MNASKQQSWERFKKFYFEFPQIGLAVDRSKMNISDEFIAARVLTLAIVSLIWQQITI